MSTFEQNTPIHRGGDVRDSPTSIAGWPSGDYIDLARPHPDSLHVPDIANGLAMTCRFAGQVRRFYSVAEHSVFVLDLLKRVYGVQNADILRWALLHDAQEAYIGDVTAPLKRALSEAGGGYAPIEAAFEAAVAERFSLTPMDELTQRLIKAADMQARYLEGRRLKPDEPTWDTPLGNEMPEAVACAFGESPAVARQVFLVAGFRLGLWSEALTHWRW